MPLDPKKQSLVNRVLDTPDMFPDEFKAWIPRFVQANVNFKLSETQLPTMDARHFVGALSEPPFQNSWVNYAGGNEVAGYYRDQLGIVHLFGLVKSGTVGVAIFTLPSGYRPEARELFPVLSNDTIGRVDVLGTGDVIFMSGSNIYVSLAGITFRAFS